MAKPKIKHTISKKEWNKKHKDFKLMGRDGIPYIMMYDDKIGTHLVPVKIVESEIEEGIASTIDQIRQDSNDIRDFLKKVFSDSDFRDMKNDKDFIQYLKSIYEGVTESVNEGKVFVVMFKVKKDINNRNIKPSSAVYAKEEDAKKFLKSVEKDGGNGMIVKSNKPVGVKVNEVVEPHIKKTADILKLDAKTVEKFASTPTPNGPINMVKVLKLAKMANDAGKRNLIKYIKGEAPATNKKSYDKHLAEAKDVETYHKSFTHAAEAARAYALKKGYLVDEDDWQSQVAFGGRYSRSRPGVGKTHSFSVGLLKNGKPQRKALNFSVYGMDSGNFELTAYIN